VDASDGQAESRVGIAIDSRYRVGISARFQQDARDRGRVFGALHFHAIGGDVVEKSRLVGKWGALKDQAGVVLQ